MKDNCEPPDQGGFSFNTYPNLPQRGQALQGEDKKIPRKTEG
jgi:hypothetical protein